MSQNDEDIKNFIKKMEELVKKKEAREAAVKKEQEWAKPQIRDLLTGANYLKLDISNGNRNKEIKKQYELAIKYENGFKVDCGALIEYAEWLLANGKIEDAQKRIEAYSGKEVKDQKFEKDYTNLITSINAAIEKKSASNKSNNKSKTQGL